MRAVGIMMVAATFAAGASAQQTPVEKPRFGIAPNYDLYPQNTPKAALETATKLLENKRYDYFVAHVLDPAVLEARIQDRAQRIEKEVELQLAQKRDEQKRNPAEVIDRERLSVEPKAFAAAVREEALARSFKYVVRDLQTQLTEAPENLKAFRRFLVEGQVADAGTTASFTHKDFAGRAVYLKNDGKHWFLEDRQTEEPKPMTEK